MTGSGNMKEIILSENEIIDEKEEKNDDGKPPKKKRGLLIVLIVIAAAVAACLIALVYYSRVTYKDRWYPNSTVNGVDVSGMTLEESRAAVIEKMENYALTVSGREDGKLVIRAQDVDYHVELPDDFQTSFEKEHSRLAFPWMKFSDKLAGKVSYDADRLEEILKYAEIYRGSVNYEIHAPHPTRLLYSKEEKQVVVEDSYAGNQLKKKPFVRAVKAALDNYETSLDLTDEDRYPKMYRTVKEKHSREELESRLPSYNEKALHYVVWEFPDGSTEQIDPEMIYGWLSWKDGQAVMDEEALDEYLNDLSDKYTTVGKSRTVKMHDGKKYKVEGGDYGWMLSYNQLSQQAKAALSDEISDEDRKAYQKKQSKKNTAKLTSTYQAPFVTTGKVFNREDPLKDYDEKNFTEVDLSEQQVYIFRKGKVVFQCNCISGRPGGKRQTRPGTFYTKERQYYRVLKGDDYETPVNYWIRITYSGVGFHAAPWQGWGSWSPTYYVYGGSHGCINLSTTNAKTVYETIDVGETVFMHYG